MVKFEDAKIYKIVDNTNGNIYIGSTCEPTLARRLAKHRSNYNLFLKGTYHFVTSFKIIENNDYDIVLMEKCNVQNRDELHARERFYIENNNCVNKIVVGRTRKEYNEDNKEHNRQYRVDHKEHYKQYRLDNKETIKQQKKQYYIENKEKNKIRDKQYYIDNKETIRQKNSEKILCECCNCYYTRNHKLRHFETQKHIKNSKFLN